MGGQTLAAVSAEMNDLVEVKTALVSVFDKTGLEELGKFLASRGVHVLSTGGTAAKLREFGCTVQDVADYTGSPEILDGRVKTLHPKAGGGVRRRMRGASRGLSFIPDPFLMVPGPDPRRRREEEGGGRRRRREE